MKEDLLKYMNRRSDKLTVEMKTAGPVLTISREKGCPANDIAEILVEKLADLKNDKKWRFVNREIIEESARELHMNPSRINHVIYSEDKGFFRDLMLSFGEKYYESDVRVKKTLAELITDFASKGNVIVVGIGGVAITRNIERSLHIKLHAPYKFRLESVMKQENMSRERAREYMDETDVNRQMLIDYYNGIKANDDLFHAQFNCALLDREGIADAILHMMTKKEMI